MKYVYTGECKGNNDNGCFMDSCGHDCGCFTREVVNEITLDDVFGEEKKKDLRKFIDDHKFMKNQISDRITLETYKELEENGVYIHYIPEHYTDGSNLNFSIEFKNQNTQTGWYNDNHEFGGVYETMYKSVHIAQWYLKDPKRIDLIDSGYNNPEYIKYKEELYELISVMNEVK